MFPSVLTRTVFHFYRHVHDRAHRKRDTTKCFNQRDVTRKRDRETGLSTVDYTIVDVKKLTIDDTVKVTVLNIKLSCDKNLTPWCDCTTGSTNANTKQKQ